MNKKNIISFVCVIIFCVILGLSFKNTQHNDSSIAITINDESVDSIPPRGEYTVNINCENATGKWLIDEWELSLENISGEVSCEIDFDTVTDDNKLTSVVKTQTENVGDAGYRYTGGNPNNYVWFNNQRWRIIGLVPVKTSSTTTENLIKIIKAESIGSLAYDSSGRDTPVWGNNNSLYLLLNEHYLGRKNATSNSYCQNYNGSGDVRCNYQTEGILSTDYYGQMVKKVYWNSGCTESTSSVTASVAYSNELATQTVYNYIGLMNASDFAYAVPSTYYNTSIKKYNTTDISSNNWMFTGLFEWSINMECGSTYYVMCSDRKGYLDSCSVNTFGANVRPVVYLDSSVYVVNGTGTQADPYIIGMN